MQIVFIILLISINELLYQVASNQRLGLNPYPLGSTIMCYITHFILLIMCIWYLGWLAGIIVFLLSFFSLLHSIFGWILVIPTLFYSTESQIYKSVYRQVSLLTPALLSSLIFCILSFIFTEYMSLTIFFKDNSNIILVLGIISIILFIIRIIVVKRLTKDNFHD